MNLASLRGKRILLGISGGIAAYKSCELTRLFTKAGAEVRIILTKAACEFVTPLSLQALSGNEPHTALLDPEAEAGMGHIELARWADLMVIAPASADCLSRLAAGEAGDLLTTVALALRAELMIAPAMNEAMWAHQASQDNIARLKERGLHIVGPDSGEQACGDIGAGRMSEPEAIAERVAGYFRTGALAGKRILITAGPTREAIDPVRYISNHSSGKMGYALAEACQEAGGEVTLISGPVCLAAPPRVRIIPIESARDMLSACRQALGDAEPSPYDLFIAAAAVADYRPAVLAEQKLKKGEADLSRVDLIENPDILATIAQEYSTLKVVGFAAETDRVREYALKKLAAKKLDMIIANDVSKHDTGFNSDNNELLVLRNVSSQNAYAQEITERHLPHGSKTRLARQLASIFAEELFARKSA